MKKPDMWISALIRLRYCHSDEIIAFHQDETYMLVELNQRFQSDLAHLVHPMEKAVLISQHNVDLRQLQEDRKLRKQALRRRQSEVLYDLLRSKSGSLAEN